MTNLRNCCLGRPRNPQPLPVSHGQHVCVVRVNVCSLCVHVSVCVSLLDHFFWLWRWTGRTEEVFFSLRILRSGGQEGSIKPLLVDCSWSFLERVWTWTLRKKAALYHLSDKSHAWIEVWSLVLLLVVRTLKITTKLDFIFPVRKKSWLLSVFVFRWALPHRVIELELQTYYCSQANKGLEWHTADTGCTPVRITARLPLNWNLIFILQLNLLQSWWTGNVCDCISEGHMVSTTFYPK